MSFCEVKSEVRRKWHFLLCLLLAEYGWRFGEFLKNGEIVITVNGRKI